jgi:hypothetical protein
MPGHRDQASIFLSHPMIPHQGYAVALDVKSPMLANHIPDSTMARRTPSEMSRLAENALGRGVTTLVIRARSY